MPGQRSQTRQQRQHGRFGSTATSFIAGAVSAALLPLTGGTAVAADGSLKAQVITDAAVHPVKEGATAKVRISVATTTGYG
ncbi:hypothetical protein AB4212_61495, partial [Streptomyces sp. 2MCAF27]